MILTLTGALLVVFSIVALGNFLTPCTPLPRAVRFAGGAALLSSVIFLILLFHCGYWPVFAALPVVLIGLIRPAALTPALPRPPRLLLVLFAVAGLFYLIYALAPEIQADAAGYHLRVVSDYVRLHAFGSRDGFYDVLPQGMEMLFVPAFALGAGPAAKLLHFAFLIATVPLIRELGREAGLSDFDSSAAAVIFFLAPVCGIAGTSAYTDAGLVCSCCALLYLLVRWDRERSSALLICAAINAGFCYAIKPTFGWVSAAAVVFVALRMRAVKFPLLFAGIALACAAPWLCRAALLSGSPVAPFFSHWIPNSVLTPETESHLAGQYSAFRSSFNWSRAWLDYALFGGNQGIFGPAFLLLPIGLLAWRKPHQRWLIVGALVLALPFLANTGARFLMPAFALAVLAMASVLPRVALTALLAIQAVTALPPILDLYDNHGDWRFGNPPLAAALRIEPPELWLHRNLPGFDTARMLATRTPDDAKILACTGLPESYVPREVLIWWHSRRAQQFADALDFAMMSQGTRARLVSWRWPGNRYLSLRVTALSDLRLVSASFPRVPAQGNSWRLYRAGESIDIAAPKSLTGADMLLWPGDEAREKTEVLHGSGEWREPDGSAERNSLNIDLLNIDLRRDATAYIRRSGYRYILVPVADDPFARIGIDMVRHPDQWGVTVVSHSGSNYLVLISPDLL